MQTGESWGSPLPSQGTWSVTLGWWAATVVDARPGHRAAHVRGTGRYGWTIRARHVLGTEVVWNGGPDYDEPNHALQHAADDFLTERGDEYPVADLTEIVEQVRAIAGRVLGSKE